MRSTPLICAALLLSGCSDSGPPGDDGNTPQNTTYMTKEQMLDPESCKECHQSHYTEWSGSMHAYASTDPVFLAMNRRGQEETNGALGDFCVRCHAPVALQLGLTTDGLNLDEVPAYAQGVTCYYCHTIDSVEGSHNADLTNADDLVMRGPYADPVANSAHASAYSELLDRERIESASACGSCHDIVTPKGVHLERTFEEWKNSLYANEVPGQQQTCGNCHMPGRDDVAAESEGVFLRRVHDHSMAGVDIALTPFPEQEAQKDKVQKSLDNAVFALMCVEERGGKGVIEVRLEVLSVGHSWPSGAAHDRRAWVELVAYDEQDNVIYQSGVVEEGQALTSLEDPNLWRLGDKAYDEEGKEAHMFWDIASVESELLQAPTAHDPNDPAYTDVHRIREYVTPTPPSRVTLAIHIRPMGLDLLDDLIASGHLDPAIRDTMPTFTLGTTELEWKAEWLTKCIPLGHEN